MSLLAGHAAKIVRDGMTVAPAQTTAAQAGRVASNPFLARKVRSAKPPMAYVLNENPFSVLLNGGAIPIVARHVVKADLAGRGAKADMQDRAAQGAKGVFEAPRVKADLEAHDAKAASRAHDGRAASQVHDVKAVSQGLAARADFRAHGRKIGLAVRLPRATKAGLKVRAVRADLAVLGVKADPVLAMAPRVLRDANLFPAPANRVSINSSLFGAARIARDENQAYCHHKKLGD